MCTQQYIEVYCSYEGLCQAALYVEHSLNATISPFGESCTAVIFPAFQPFSTMRILVTITFPLSTWCLGSTASISLLRFASPGIVTAISPFGKTFSTVVFTACQTLCTMRVAVTITFSCCTWCLGSTTTISLLRFAPRSVTRVYS